MEDEGNLIWVVLSLQAASIGQIPVFLCCLGLLLTPLLVTCDGPGRLAAFSNLAVLVSLKSIRGQPELARCVDSNTVSRCMAND